MRGAPFTGGVWARRHAIGQSDSDVVLALKAADVIVLGSTNTSEACSELSTFPFPTF
jgi:Asp-tRNA(Asn)/Glu-tRNA(Gln) amidotransferase A subunit family amidase